MVRLPVNKPQWIFIYAILLHLVWGVVLLWSASPLGVTAISSVVSLGFVTPHSAGLLYVFVAFLALMGLFAPKPAGFFFLLPQQLVLICAAFGAIQCMITGTFADGVVRSTPFLVAVQSPTVIAAILHTLAVWTNFLRMGDY